MNQYWSAKRAVLVTLRTSTGNYHQPVLVGRVTSTGSHHPPIEQTPQTLYTQSIPHYRRGYQSPLSLYDQETWRQILPLEKKAPQLE